jgi:hypothetical protein
LTAGKREKATCQSSCSLGPAHGIVKGALQVGRAGQVLGTTHGGLQIADDDHHQIVEVVGNAAAQLADGLHLLRCGELLLSRFQGALRFHSLGDVAGDFGEANRLAGLVANRIDHHERAKARAILAQTPSLGFVFALARGNLQRPFGYARRTILKRIELPEMMADDLVRGVMRCAPVFQVVTWPVLSSWKIA